MTEQQDSFEMALDAFANGLVAAHLPSRATKLEEVRARIESLKKEKRGPELAEETRQLRAELIGVLQAIVQTADPEPALHAEDAGPLSTEQTATIKQRFEACLQYVADRQDRQGKPSGGDLAWLARLRV